MNTRRIASAGTAAALTGVFCWCVLGQEPASPAAGPEAASHDKKGLPPRAAPADYQAHAQAGAVTIGAEVKGHSVPTEEATFTSEDYLAIEVGLFGPSGTRVNLSPQDFTLRINRKKTPLPVEPYELVFKSLKDPEWVPPTPPEGKSKGSFNAGGGGTGGQDNAPPPTPKMPFDLVRAMDQRVQRAVLPEGERTLPVAGLVFFSFHGKTAAIHSMVLTYNGSAGKANLLLEP
jgi:hypothetical protein